jgi:G3E family GTPase
MPLPVHLICGPLGVGKTTAILDRLRRSAGREFTAVLVNDFGPVGLDGPIIESTAGAETRDLVKVKMVPGGCVCCTAAAYFVQALGEVARLPRVDRVLIEPSGLAAPDQMVEVLRQLTEQLDLDLRPVIVLLDPAKVRPELVRRIPYWQRFVDVADILVANRCDRATAEQVDAFLAMARDWKPPKAAIVTTANAELPEEVWSLQKSATPGATPAFFSAADSEPFSIAGDRPSAHDGQAGGLQWEPARRFDLDRLTLWLQELNRNGLDGVPILRLKSLLNTPQGWRQLEIASGDVIIKPTAYRSLNRLDGIAAAPGVDEGRMRAMVEQWSV